MPRLLLLSLTLSLTCLKALECPRGYVQGGNGDASWAYCFTFFNEESTWFDAERRCKDISDLNWQLGQTGQIASIDDDGVNNVIRLHGCGDSGIPGYPLGLWIGANRGITSDGWNWSDGSQFTWTHWASDESSDGSGPRCAYMNSDSGIWSTDDCNAKRPFVCKIYLMDQSVQKPCPTCSSTCPTLPAAEASLCATPNSTQHSMTSSRVRIETTDETTTDRPPLPLALIIVPPLVFLTLLGGALFVAYRYFCVSGRTGRSRSRHTTIRPSSVISSVPNKRSAVALDVNDSFDSSLYPIKIAPSDLTTTSQILSTGTFSTVYKGYMDSSSSPGVGNIPGSRAISGIYEDGRSAVAVKVLHDRLVKTHRSDVLSEVESMLRLGMATHIVGLIGYTYLNEVPVLVSEYCGKGDVLSFLRESLADYQDCIRTVTDGLQTRPYSNTDLSLIDLVSFAWQISDGMEFLSSHAFVHRQLTASNILLTTRHVAKISGFGSCRHSGEALWTICREAEAPLKWMAPETLSEPKFSTESDIWSYGIVLFEIFSAGSVPYEHVESADLLQFLVDGHRLEQPTLAPIDIYRLMMQCWAAAPSERTSFDEIRRFLSKCLEELAECREDASFMRLSDL